MTETQEPSNIEKGVKEMALPIPLYVPNLLGYARILLAFVALYLSRFYPVTALVVWFISGFLDLFDGMLARALDQCSSYGILVDIAADNIMRTTAWIAAVAESQSPWVPVIASIVISVEWTTMVCTQLHATQSEKHWKAARENDPWLIRCIFANNFKTPLGFLCLHGLFVSGQCVYVRSIPPLYDRFPFGPIIEYAAYTGRAITFLAECWLCKGYLTLVCERDVLERDKAKETAPNEKKGE